MIHIREATLDDAAGQRDLLREGIAGGAFCAEDSDGIICLWGFIPDSLLGSSAYMWFYPMRSLDRFRTRFLRANRRYITEVLRSYPVIHGTVERDLPAARKWLGWLGFKETTEFEYEGKAYLRLELRA